MTLQATASPDVPGCYLHMLHGSSDVRAMPIVTASQEAMLNTLGSPGLQVLLRGQQ